MPVRRRRTQRVAKRQEAARVLRITDDGQWQKLQSKLGDRLLLIHFSAVPCMQHDPIVVCCSCLCHASSRCSACMQPVWYICISCISVNGVLLANDGGVVPCGVQTWAKPSQLLRPYIAEIARRPSYSHVVFAEIDVDQLSAGQPHLVCLWWGARQGRSRDDPPLCRLWQRAWACRHVQRLFAGRTSSVWRCGVQCMGGLHSKAWHGCGYCVDRPVWWTTAMVSPGHRCQAEGRAATQPPS
jgi:hypothetical protein